MKEVSFLLFFVPPENFLRLVSEPDAGKQPLLVAREQQLAVRARFVQL